MNIFKQARAHLFAQSIMVSSIAMKHEQLNLASVICFQIVKGLNKSIRPIDRTQTGTTTPSQNRPWSNYNEEMLHIAQISKSKASASHGLVSYPGHTLGWGSYYFAEMQSLYSISPANWTLIFFKFRQWMVKLISWLLRLFWNNSLKRLKRVNYFSS